MKKRILGIALAICMMIFCVPMGVFAESAADVWDGTADTSCIRVRLTLRNTISPRLNSLQVWHSL